MKFQKIDFEHWDRREIFQYFKGTTLYMNVHIDITEFLEQVRAAGIKFYPAFIHCLAGVANAHDEFRYGYDGDGCVGIWARLDPLYTVPRTGNPALFSMVATEYCEGLHEFCARFEDDRRRAQNCGKLLCSGEIPPNAMGVTAVPGVHFSSFSFGGAESKPDLAPFFVIGKYEWKAGRLMLPLCGEFAHEVNDGYHISCFFDALKEKLNIF